MDILKNKVSLAPMVDRTDNNFRSFFRLLSKNILLYTEMITDKAIINSSEKVLNIYGKQNPLVLQLATNNVFEAKKAIEIAEKYDYDEININLGCPSDRISDNKMGAYLMSELKLVTEIVKGIKSVTDKPISVKHRIGIDGTNVLEGNKCYRGYEYLSDFVYNIHKSGVDKFIIHAREGILKGLSPKQNRTIPPLDYEMVYKIKRDFKDLFIEINGGIKTVEDVKKHLNYVDAVMIGRAFYDNPLLALDIEKEIFKNSNILDFSDILQCILKEIQYKDSKQIHRYLMHTIGLFLGKTGSSKWKQLCSTTKITEYEIEKFIEEYIKC